MKNCSALAIFIVLLTAFKSLSAAETPSNSTASTIPSSDTSTASTFPSSDTSTASSSPSSNTSTASTPPSSSSSIASSETTSQMFPSTESASESTDNPAKGIKILLTNDIEYNLFPLHRENSSLCSDTIADETQTDADCIGGLRRLVGYVDEHSGDYHLVVDAGNIAGPTLFPRLKFNPLTRAVERLNFTAMAVDAELLAYGTDAMQRGFLGAAAVAVAANLAVGSEELPKSRTVAWEQRCDVAIIGVVGRGRVDELSVPGVNASDEVSAVEEELARLAKGGSEAGRLITIVVGNINESTTEAIANISGVDVVIFSGGSVSDSLAEIGSLPNVTRLGSAYLVTMQRSAHFPFVLGDLELVLDSDTGCTLAGVKLEPLDYSTYNQTGDAAVEELERAGAARLRQMTGQRLATGVAAVPGAGCPAGECALGDLVTDAVVTQLMAQEQSAPRLALYPGRGFRNNTQLPVDITGTAVDALFERDDFLYSLSLPAPWLKSLLEESVADGNESDFLQISALMSVEFDLGRPAGSRVANVGVVSGDTVAFSPVNLTDDAANYSVAVSASLLWSHPALQDAARTFHLLSVSEAVKAHVLRAGVLVVAPASGRVTYVAPSPTPTPSPAPTVAPVTATCHDGTASTVFITLLVTTACVAGGVLFWLYALPRISLLRARRDSSLPLVVHY
ncbi:uncharacterized protein LOC134539544 [Bacillus rossius redtenbacheri]|uniref:uncharacterized protein LOC134539544 n=1 Tax=Bacillus rossius redtenbacheri TaxID=93214 RepID=UPI002FDD0AFE